MLWDSEHRGAGQKGEMILGGVNFKSVTRESHDQRLD